MALLGAAISRCSHTVRFSKAWSLILIPNFNWIGFNYLTSDTINNERKCLNA